MNTMGAGKREKIQSRCIIPPWIRCSLDDDFLGHVFRASMTGSTSWQVNGNAG